MNGGSSISGNLHIEIAIGPAKDPTGGKPGVSLLKWWIIPLIHILEICIYKWIFFSTYEAVSIRNDPPSFLIKHIPKLMGSPL